MSIIVYNGGIGEIGFDGYERRIIMSRYYGLSNYSRLFASDNSMTSFYNNLSQYSSIKSGAYKKATKALYQKSSSSNTDNKNNNSISKDYLSNFSTNSKEFSTIKTKSTSLVDAGNKLISTEKDSLFVDKNNYDKDKIYDAVKGFVSDYNSTVDSLNAVTNKSIKTVENNMTRMTDVMSNSLSKVGINVGTDGKLSVNEDKFMDSDMNQVKSLFNGSSSYAGMITSYASKIANQANSQLSLARGSLYGSNGSYYTGLNSGSFYNRYL